MKKKQNLAYVTFVTIAFSIYVVILFVVAIKHIESLNECFNILKDNPNMITSILNLNATKWADFEKIEKILGIIGMLLIAIHAFFINALLRAYKGATLSMMSGNVTKTSTGELKTLQRENDKLKKELEAKKNELVTYQVQMDELQMELEELKGGE